MSEWYGIDWTLFTDEEIERALTIIANHRPLCCAREGVENRKFVTRSKKKQEMLSIFAYEGMGCQSESDERWDNYFEYLVDCIDDAQERHRHVSNVGRLIGFFDVGRLIGFFDDDVTIH